MIRTEQAPDLDGNNFCGLYKSRDGSFMAIGSWVCGVEDDQNFGKFIGVNNRVVPTSTKKVPMTNVYEITSSVYIDILNFSQSNESSNNSEYVILGKTYDLQVPKYLVYWDVKGMDQPYTWKRYFILEGVTNPLSARKFWYCDTNQNNSTAAQFFRGVINVDYNSKSSLTFKYKNLDDETDTKNDIVFSNIGLTAKNAYAHLLNNPVGDLNIKTYICNWIIPGVQKEEIE